MSLCHFRDLRGFKCKAQPKSAKCAGTSIFISADIEPLAESWWLRACFAQSSVARTDSGLASRSKTEHAGFSQMPTTIFMIC